MKARIKNVLLLLPLLLGLTACPNPPPAEESCNFVQNSFSRRVSWAVLPIQFYVDDSLDDDQIRGLIDAMEVWNEQFTGPVFEVLGQRNLPNPQMNADQRVLPDGFNGIYVVDPTIFENTTFRDEQARTSISFRGDHIYESDILIDGSEEFYYSNNDIQATSRRVQFKSLMIHELGHALGLGHIEEPQVQSVMYPRLEYGQYRGELSDTDLASIACEY